MWLKVTGLLLSVILSNCVCIIVVGNLDFTVEMSQIDPEGEVLSGAHIDLRDTETKYNGKIPRETVRNITFLSSPQCKKAKD